MPPTPRAGNASAYPRRSGRSRGLGDRLATGPRGQSSVGGVVDRALDEGNVAVGEQEGYPGGVEAVELVAIREPIPGGAPLARVPQDHARAIFRPEPTDAPLLRRRGHEDRARDRADPAR